MTPQECAELIKGTKLHKDWPWREGDLFIFEEDLEKMKKALLFKGLEPPPLKINVLRHISIRNCRAVLYHSSPICSTSYSSTYTIEDFKDAVPDLMNPHMLDRVLGLIAAAGWSYSQCNHDELGRITDDFTIYIWSVSTIKFTAPTPIEAAVKALLHVYGIKEADNG